MAWANGGVGSKIPASIKRTIRQQQQGRCNTIDPNVCTGQIDEYDHIINVKILGIDRAHANDPSNIQGLCIPCHKVKTQAEARAGSNRWKRPTARHPGLA